VTHTLYNVEVVLDEATEKAAREIYTRLLRETVAMVDRHWSAIVRAAKHLERHGRINDQATLDNLISINRD
jgi:predicted nucleic acid-binding protein